MPTKILKTETQVRTFFDDGKLKEQMPVSVESEIKGTSTLYHIGIVSSKDNAVREVSSRKGFEIISYVLEGSVETQNGDSETVEKMEKDGVRLIRAASGVSYKETYTANSKMLEVYLDPDFRTSLQRPSSMVFYAADEFETEEINGLNTLELNGDDSPMWWTTKSQIRLVDYPIGTYTIKVKSGTIFSAYIVSGEFTLSEEGELKEGDFFMTNTGTTLELVCKKPGKIFIVQNRTEAGYRTYTSQLQLHT